MVSPGDCAKDHTPPYNITMADFLSRLERIRQVLWLEHGAYVPGNGLTFVKKGDIRMLFRFVSLNDVADVWGDNMPDALAKIVYEKLNAFLDGITIASNDNLKERWKDTIGRYKDASEYPRDPVWQSITAVQNDCDRSEMEKRYGVREFPKHCYDGKIPDRSIISILGLILFWFAALPCTDEAKEERTRYRRRLELKLDLLLAPERTSEFLGLLREVYDDLVLDEIRGTRCPKHFQADKERDNSQIHENAINKNMHYDK